MDSSELGYGILPSPVPAVLPPTANIFLILAHPGIAGEQPRPALRHTVPDWTIDVVASLRAALPRRWA